MANNKKPKPRVTIIPATDGMGNCYAFKGEPFACSTSCQIAFTLFTRKEYRKKK